MKKKIIGVFGTTHLATVITSSFLKKNFKVILFELDVKKLNDIKNGKFTIYEPHVEEVIKKAIKTKKIIFSNNLRKDSKKIDVLYYAKDSLKTKYGINEKIFADEFLKILNQLKTKIDII
jgi:UDP-glucose 6-dehydrogenase